MSLMNDYLVSLLVAQRQQDLQNQGREARLARLARGDRARWWQRLIGSGGRGRAAGAVAQRPVAMPPHRVAH
jgi:hypothetical protein